MQYLMEEVDRYATHLVFLITPDRIYIYLYIYIFMCVRMYILFVQVVPQASASSEPFMRYLDVDVWDVNVGDVNFRKADIHAVLERQLSRP